MTAIHGGASTLAKLIRSGKMVVAPGVYDCITARMVEQVGGVVAGLGFVVELTFLHGRGRLPGYDLFSLPLQSARWAPVAGTRR